MYSWKERERERERGRERERVRERERGTSGVPLCFCNVVDPARGSCALSAQQRRCAMRCTEKCSLQKKVRCGARNGARCDTRSDASKDARCETTRQKLRIIKRAAIQGRMLAAKQHAQRRSRWNSLAAASMSRFSISRFHSGMNSFAAIITWLSSCICEEIAIIAAERS